MFAKLGAFCFDRRRVVALVWVALLVAGLAASGALTSRLKGDQGTKDWESVRAYDKIRETAPYGTEVGAIVDGLTITDPVLVRAVKDAEADLKNTPGIGTVEDPVSSDQPLSEATDHRALLITVKLERGLPQGREDAVIEQTEQRLRGIAGAAPGTKVTIGGDTLLRREVNTRTRADTTVGEIVALPLTLIVMTLIFAGFVAAAVPFVGALASISGGLLTLYGFSYLLDLDPNVLSVTTVLGLGLSIDYSLLIVSRFREERAGGAEPRQAVISTVMTAGRTITFSALTVATALAGLFVFPSKIFRAVASAGVGVVVVALLVGLTLTPALLSMWHPKIRVRAAQSSGDGVFARMARLTRRHAILVTVGITAVLVAAGLPFLHANFQNSTSALLPKGFESRRFAELKSTRFPGGGSAPIVVVANTDATTLQLWALSLNGTPGVAAAARADQRTPGVSLVTILPKASSRDAEAGALVKRLRADRPPFTIWITGDAAVLIDFKHEVATRAPWALGLVAIATFILLFAMTGSLLVPLKALVMNVLSLGASFGALKLIFQDGHLSGLLGFQPTGGLETWVPVLVFAFAFGLSMDYEVFLLARVKELYDSGLSNDEAVEVGLQRSGRIITSA
ncbi:MAG: putative drug exporter of the superfamily, partial [Cryptosporangiaceae bacterium]|nr:putative drug exporter of the superfamily [Cryptosporangiaceae bacterium]